MSAQRYTVAQIAEALGIKRQSADYRLRGIPYNTEINPNGGKPLRLYARSDLPRAVRDALDTHAKCAQLESRCAEAAQMLQAVDDAARDGRLSARQFRDDAERIEADLRLGGYQARLEVLRRFPSLSENQLARTLARLEVVQHYLAWLRRNRKKGGTKALNEFACQYGETGAGCGAGTREHVKKVSGRNLRRWADGFAVEGLAALVDSKDGRALEGHGKIEDQPELRSFVIALLVEFPHIKDTQIDDAIGARFGTRLAPVTDTLAQVQRRNAEQPQAEPLLARPERTAIGRFRTRWLEQNRGVYEALRNPDKYKSERQLAFGDAAGDVTRPNYRWELDSTPGDVLLLEPGTASGTARYSVIGAVDVWTRRMKLLVSKTSKASAIGSLVRRAVMDWGVPERVKHDNGADYCARWVQTFFAAIGTEVELCAPFAGEQKPHIERGLGTFNHDLVELLPGYIGHNVADRKEIEARSSFAKRLFERDAVLEVRMTAAEFQQFCDEWCENRYAHRPHEGLDGDTPFNRAASWPAPLARIEDERALDILLAPLAGSNGGHFSLQKKGIRIHGHWYIAPELGARTVGERFQVREDAADMGRKYVFDADGAFVCVAECPELTGVSQQEIANKARAIQRETIKAQKAELRRVARQADVKDIAAEILRDRVAQTGKLASLPPRGPVHTTAAIDAAGRAARADERAAAAAGQMVIGGQVVPATSLPASAEVTELAPRSRSARSAADNYAEWLDLDTRIAAGEAVSEADARWHRTYQSTAQFRAQAKATNTRKQA